MIFIFFFFHSVCIKKDYNFPQATLEWHLFEKCPLGVWKTSLDRHTDFTYLVGNSIILILYLFPLVWETDSNTFFFSNGCSRKAHFEGTKVSHEMMMVSVPKNVMKTLPIHYVCKKVEHVLLDWTDILIPNGLSPLGQ